MWPGRPASCLQTAAEGSPGIYWNTTAEDNNHHQHNNTKIPLVFGLKLFPQAKQRTNRLLIPSNPPFDAPPRARTFGITLSSAGIRSLNRRFSLSYPLPFSHRRNALTRIPRRAGRDPRGGMRVGLLEHPMVKRGSLEGQVLTGRGITRGPREL